MKNLLKVPSEITRVQTMADGGLRLFVDTQEVGAEEKGLIMGLHKKIGWFLFAETDIPIEETLNLPEIKLDKGQKSEAQRMRATLYRLWEKHGKQGSSEEHYKNWMNRAIEKLKEGL